MDPRDERTAENRIEAKDIVVSQDRGLAAAQVEDPTSRHDAPPEGPGPAAPIC
jgi:uncharacterized protein YaiI (UPF0178 family)